MKLDEIYTTLTEILRNVFDDDDVVARPNLTADQVGGWDSFGHLRLMFNVEKTFGISFAASQIAGMQNLGDLAELIRTKTAG